MSSSYSADTKRFGEPVDEEMPMYSPDSESVNGASPASESARGQEEASTSGRENQGGEDSPLDDLFTYRPLVRKTKRGARKEKSPTRSPRGDSQIGEGASHPQIISESPARELTAGESLMQVKIEEGEWEYNPLVEEERSEAWVGSGAAGARRKKKKKSKKRQPLPRGASWCTEESLETLRRECGIPREVALIAPDVDQREDDPPEGTFTAYEVWFRGCFLTFPIQKLILRFVFLHRIALAQINSSGVRNLVGIMTRASECGESIGFRHLFNLLDFRKNKNPEGKKFYNLANRIHYKVIDDLPNKDHNWRKFFFFVPISPASVEHEYPGMAKWGTLAEKELLLRNTPGIEDLLAKLSEEKCLWERHFHLGRVVKARSEALKDESDELSQSASEDIEVMPQRPSFREEKKKKKAAKMAKAVALADAPSAAETSAKSAGRDATPTVEGREMVVAGATTTLIEPSAEPISVPEDTVEAEEVPLKKRKSSALDKGKGKASESKKRRKEMPSLHEGALIPSDLQAGGSPPPSAVYLDPSSAASLMAKITYPGDRFPISEKLVLSDFYEEFAVRQMKALAHFNRMVIKYDHEARSRQLFIDEQVEREKVEKKETAAKMAALKDELKTAKQSSDDVFKHLGVVKTEKEESERRVAELEQEVSTLKAGHEEEVRKAVASARREATAEVSAQLSSAHTLFARLMKRPFKHMVYFAQGEANLQLLEDMENAAEDDPFDPAKERAEIEGDMAKWSASNTEFDDIVGELKGVLGKNLGPFTNLDELEHSPWSEIVAKSVGINTASGSNDGSLGLRMREASEELSDESDEGDLNKDDKPRNETHVEPTSSAPVVEKPAGEAASSSAPAREEKDKEEGEV